MEIEAKFAIPDRLTFDELLAQAQLAGMPLSDPRTRRVVDRYLDTEARDLLRGGYFCRVRASRDRFLVTLKGTQSSSGGALHTRRELECVIETPDDQPVDWPQGEARGLALQLTGGRPLREMFLIRQNRHVRNLGAEASPLAQLSLDEVHVQAGPRTDDYFELEAELLAGGDVRELEAFAEQLRRTWALQPQTRSKFERGLALLDLD